jgi:integrase
MRKPPMASHPYIDPRRGDWYMKYKPVPHGPWVRVKLGRHPMPFPRDKPPRKPPHRIIERAAEFAEIEWRAKHRLPTAGHVQKSLRDYSETYLAGFAATHREGSTTQANRNVRRFVAFAEQRQANSIQAVTRALCRDFMERRLGEGATSRSIKTERSYIAPMFARALIDELILSNPWTGLKVPGRDTEHFPTYWTSGQVAAIASAADRPWMRDLVIFLANTGIRISAALAARWDWIDFDRRVIEVPAEFDKAGKSYRAILTKFLRETLDEMRVRKSGPLLFPNRDGKPRLYLTAAKAFERAVKKAQVPRGTFHDLRHTFGRLLMMDAPAHVVRAALGHGSLAMTDRYTKIDGELASRAVQGFSVGGEPVV